MQVIDPSKMTEKESFLWHLGHRAYHLAVFWRTAFVLSLIGNVVQCGVSYLTLK
jgi:hypothetical protein